MIPDSWEKAAAEKKKPAKPRKPEEVWYDVHKHPEGVPGGMGKSPEHHLRNRGWQPYVINGAGSRTIQYRNPEHPDFVISFGGASPTHPDHNFRVLYLGGNRNIPKVTQAYSVAEAMNKAEELKRLDSGLVVQPMLHDSASKVPYTPVNPPPQRSPQQFVAPDAPANPAVTAPGRRIGPSQHQLTEDTAPETNPNPDPQLHQIPNAPAPKQEGATKYGSGPPRMQNDHGTIKGARRDRAAGEVCPLCRSALRIYDRDPALYHDLVQDSGGLTEEHLRTTSPFHDRVQAAITLPPRSLSRRTPDGPATIGRTEYTRQYREKQRAALDADTVQVASWHGMHLEPEDVARYPRLRSVISAYDTAQRESWEV